jgi:hypothetical protein
MAHFSRGTAYRKRSQWNQILGFSDHQTELEVAGVVIEIPDLGFAMDVQPE